ncbi:unnamed protein product [Sphenostylis stenocarpa]|uniref:Uncharacterized protein n=1 Tax=Sphenostylis stenocarpa TaxID=92480 RepID=A0AA86T0A2_9FABA|nr:unnamed protein product [Sphenostylis stenocarpa]
MSCSCNFEVRANRISCLRPPLNPDLRYLKAGADIKTLKVEKDQKTNVLCPMATNLSVTCIAYATTHNHHVYMAIN